MNAAYVKVDANSSSIRIVAVSQSPCAQIIRISAAHQATKMHKIPDFETVELRPSVRGQSIVKLPPRTAPYWLSLVAFSHDGGSWSQSSLENAEPFRVPLDLRFKPRRTNLLSPYSTPGTGLVVSLTYV